MIGIRLTKIANGMLDIKRENGRAVWAENGVEAAQHGAVRLQIFQDESVTDDPEDDFTDWYGTVFNMAKSRAEKEFELKRRILGTPGVTKIIKFEWTQTDHALEIIGNVLTEWGEADIGQVITIL